MVSETMVLNCPRYFAERYEVSLAEDVVHEYKHILQQHLQGAFSMQRDQVSHRRPCGHASTGSPSPR
jgi:hypothetical protein